MKHILFLLLFLPVLAYAQFPANPNKIRLGNQTTGDGLVVRTAASPSWTPSTINNAWLAFDTVAVKLYYYDDSAWNEYTGGSVNIGNTDLTLTGNRRLNTGGYQFWIQDGTGSEVPYIYIGGDQVSFAASTTTSIYLDSSEQRAAIVAGAVIDIDADSIRIIGTQPNDNTLNRLLAIDTLTNRLHYVDKASIQSTDTNFATDNLTFSGNRVHNLSTRTLTIADGGTYPTFQQSAATDGFTLASSATDLIAQTPGLLQIENSDTITITADRIRLNAADTRIQQVPKDNALNRLVALDSLTGRLYYVDKASIAGGGGTVTGTGTTGTIPVWSSSTALGDSPLTVSGTDVTATGTGMFRLPNGTTAQRPGTPLAGMTRYNTSLGYSETYGASAWLQSALPTGTAGQTLRSDGTSWIANSVLTNNGTDVINTGAHQATTYASTTGSCAQVAGGHYRGNLTGAIEITVPNWATLGFFSLSFDVSVHSINRGNHVYKINTRGRYSGGIGTWTYNKFECYVIGGQPNTTGNIRIGNDGTNIKIWIGELGTVWGGTTILVHNVHVSQQTGSIAEIEICKGWTVTQENTAFNTVSQTIPISYQPIQDIATQDNVGNLDFFSESKRILGGTYIGASTGAVRITLPDSTLVTPADKNPRIYFDVLINSPSSSVSKKISIHGRYNYATGAWSETGVTLEQGLGAGLSYRFGKAGSAPCVYVGELASSWSNVQVLISGLVTYNTIIATHNILSQNTWAVAIESSAFSSVTQTVTTGAAGSIPATSATGMVYSSNLVWNNADNRLGIGNAAPARTLHVTGEARITDLTTDTPTRIVGADADGDLGSITVGSGLSLSSGTLSATGAGTTNLSFSGASSPVTLTSDTGTDVIFAAGSGLSLTQSGGTATYSRTYSLTHTTITGGSTFFGTTAERPDNDTPGSATTSTVGSDFSVSGSTINYTGGSGALLRVEGSISFSVADDGDYYVSMYKEGTELGATSMRVSCVAGNYYSISLPATTTSGSTNDTFDLRIATVSGNSTTTMHRYGFIIERIY